MIKTEKRTETEALFQDLDKPSLVALSYALRHPETWPADFYWDYGDCDQCAMGLAHQLWKQHVDEPSFFPDADAVNGNCSIIAKAFAISFSDARYICYGVANDYQEDYLFGLLTRRIPMEHVTPDMVADAIDNVLARS